MIYLIIGTIFNIFAECFKIVNYIRYFFTNNEYEIKEYKSDKNENKLRILNWNIHYGKSFFETDNLIKMCELINKLNIDNSNFNFDIYKEGYDLNNFIIKKDDIIDNVYILKGDEETCFNINQGDNINNYEKKIMDKI